MRRITMEDVAREAGVSRALVSLAYRAVPGVSAGTRERILRVGAELGYTPNQLAARLAGRGGDTIGVFLQDLHNDVFAEIHDGIRDVAGRAGKSLVLAIGAIDGSLDARAIETLQRSRVDLMIAAGMQLPDDAVRSANARVPIVTVARHVPGVDGAVSDDRYGARVATEHLLGLGHRRIVFLANPPTDGYLDRGVGYAETMAAAGCEARAVVTSYARAMVATDAGVLLDSGDPPTAFFAHNDPAALGVLDALASRGLRAGYDVSVIGYDNSAMSRFPGSALTTVDVHSRELGRAAAEVALRRIGDRDAAAEVHWSRPDLVIRASTGPAPR